LTATAVFIDLPVFDGAAFAGAIILAVFFHPPSEAVKEPPVEMPRSRPRQ